MIVWVDKKFNAASSKYWLHWKWWSSVNLEQSFTRFSSFRLDWLSADWARELLLEPRSEAFCMENVSLIALELCNIVILLREVLLADHAIGTFISLNHLTGNISEVSDWEVLHSLIGLFTPLSSDLFSIHLVIKKVQIFIIELLWVAQPHNEPLWIASNAAQSDWKSAYMGTDVYVGHHDIESRHYHKHR